MAKNTEFELLGINHLAPACRDMKETVDFYSGILGMPLVCTTKAGELGQVFMFDAGQFRPDRQENSGYISSESGPPA